MREIGTFTYVTDRKSKLLSCHSPAIWITIDATIKLFIKAFGLSFKIREMAFFSNDARHTEADTSNYVLEPDAYQYGRSATSGMEVSEGNNCPAADGGGISLSS